MTVSENKVLIIVDGYSSGCALPKVMSELGWQCVHVQSQKVPPSYFRAAFKESDYLAEIPYMEDFNELLETTKMYGPLAVQPGTESGVFLADRLAFALDLPGSDPDTSNARRDKYSMHELLRSDGVRCADHYVSSELAAMTEWAEQGSWPVVVKPRASAGSDSVTFCSDKVELEKAFKNVFGAVNKLGERNDDVLAQRMLYPTFRAI